jgi:hypothetical protein
MLFSARRGNLTIIDLRKEKPGKDALLTLMLGPTGNLRAPTVRIGRTLIVGFDEGIYKKFLL